ncbi:MAG: hypothetical protein JO129_02835 [Candidatus Dependentiae bacterium]|nr:hypothetical protein [Candidatus Dependentiae bacterium]
MVKKSIKKLLVGLAAVSAVNVYGSSTGGEAFSTSKNYFQPRAFSANLAREMLMEADQRHRDSEGWYGEFSATGAYQRSWTSENNVNSGSGSLSTNADVNAGYGLGSFPFWSGTNTMSVSSSTYQIAHPSTSFNVDGYQFGLGQVTAPGSITLNPLVYQAGADFMFIVGSSANEPCFFAKIKAPVGVYNINPQLTEVQATPAATYAAGELSLSTSTVAAPAATMTQALAGNLPGGETASGDFVPMQYGLINGDVSTGAKFGDIEMTAGYRFISNHDNSFSVAVRAAAPTGGEATGVYMLEPIFGRGGNWGLGGYIDGHVKLWEGNNENCFVMRFMANAMHLFNADTVRSYDLIANGVGSKYLLAANYSGGSYQGVIGNLINYTTLASTSSFGVEGDAAITFAYCGRGWSWDLGYEFWGRSAETLTITGDFANQVYAVLGNQGPGVVGGAAASLACQPLAQIYTASTPQVSSPATVNTFPTTQGEVVLATAQVNRVALDQLNVAAAQQSTSLTSKVFTKLTYEWIDSNYCPHLGVMGEFEFSTSQNNALPQWGVSLIGGVSF